MNVSHSAPSGNNQNGTKTMRHANVASNCTKEAPSNVALHSTAVGERANSKEEVVQKRPPNTHQPLLPKPTKPSPLKQKATKVHHRQYKRRRSNNSTGETITSTSTDAARIQPAPAAAIAPSAAASSTSALYDACVYLPLPNDTPEMKHHVPSIPSQLLWTNEDWHRQFCEAVFDVGVAHSTPSIIHCGMLYQPAGLTTDRVKSHLQKFRNSLDKERARFLHDYDKFLGFLQLSEEEKGASNMIRLESLLGGKAVAHAAHSIMKEAALATNGEKSERGESLVGSLDNVYTTVVTEDGYGAGRIPTIQMSPQEAKSPLGASITYVHDLLQYLNRYLSEERQNCATRVQQMLGGETHPIPLKQPATVPAVVAAAKVPASSSSSLRAVDRKKSAHNVHNVSRHVPVIHNSSSSSSSSSSSKPVDWSMLEPMDMNQKQQEDKDYLDVIAQLGYSIAKQQQADAVMNDFKESEAARKNLEMANKVILEFEDTASLLSGMRPSTSKKYQENNRRHMGSNADFQLQRGDFPTDFSLALSKSAKGSWSIGQSSRNVGSASRQSEGYSGGGHLQMLHSQQGSFQSGAIMHGNGMGRSFASLPVPDGRNFQAARQSSLGESLSIERLLANAEITKKTNQDDDSFFDDSSIESDEQQQTMNHYMDAMAELNAAMSRKNGENPNNTLLLFDDEASQESDESSAWAGKGVDSRNEMASLQSFPRGPGLPQATPHASQMPYGRISEPFFTNLDQQQQLFPMNDAFPGRSSGGGPQHNQPEVSSLTFEQMMDTLFQ